MLDMMRRANRQKWFVWAVVLFVVFSFIIAVFAIWGGAATFEEATGRTWAARVNGIEISAIDLERQRRQLENAYRAMYPEQFDSFPRAMLYQQARDQLITEALAYTYALDVGLGATDREISDAIRNAPVFQRDGRFIGREQYIKELMARDFDPETYEREIGKEIAVEKLRDLIGMTVGVADSEIEEAFLNQGQTAEVDYVKIDLPEQTGEEDPPRANLERYFEEHRAEYNTPEERRAAYVLIERDAVMSSLEVTDEEIRSEYEVNQDRYRKAEQRSARHILFSVPGDATDEAASAIEQRATAVLERARAGEDFAQLARENSEDTTNASAGGDLGWFERGDMVPAFDEAVFNLPEGQISDLVRTPFGFHIIMTTGSRPAGTQPLDEVRDQIREDIRFRRAQEELQRRADELAAKLDQQVSSFEATATELGYQVGDTGFFAIDGALGPLGPMSRVASAAFQLEVGETSTALQTPRGTIFLKLLEVKEPEPAPFDSVQERVKADYLRSQALDKARASAAALVDAGYDEFKKAADSKGLSLRSTGEFTRSSAPADLGDAAKDAIFTSEAGSVVGPVNQSDGVVVARIIKRGPESSTDAEAIRSRLRDQVLEGKRMNAFNALLQSLLGAAEIEYNVPLLQQLAGS